ncbi:hypothetical protein EN962_00315 [Mesorhizobium sp. M7A.F.Ca.CA.001.09.2.1]|uniref:GAPS4 PD-(D/E)XK nuclease domain-containing protein n=1 Tax=Mesorhizobium ciceri TaxID=39645 RepID=A0AB38T9Z3_9HYPH|nr:MULTISPECIES: hypothetical protein [Mesorhizobium]RUY59338.1 hypothetical protein EN981_01245 [Mesorhizobium sp. M7A.F.Ca.CA.001.13.2.1]MDF3214819.1 hypothetical protein [Mesorhizobium ciceri]RUX78256.1 hypothetical protein EN990_02565 [Mesorhizobium sp. M7A.F.Ca.US.005.03.1.1]RUY18942.1 hypothetical protein EN991_02380 [Mesorhizobium sp. M7A.F.Ca.US.005.03.2.1]RUY32193.1 hypothetical protein EN979_00315 [Mesorhizobium sp. M7A.F.Ca.US.001.04.2.1]
MGETAGIAQIAEIISDQIFAEFLWTKIGPVNVDFKCDNYESHKVATHPTDVVFYYDEPYDDVTTYVQCDLKSYAAASIGRSQIEKAIVSLSAQVACAEISAEWQERYVHKHKDFSVSGLLFIYNHDGGYDRTFSDNLEKLDFDDLHTPKNGKLVVLGPAEIHWLNNVSQEILRMRGRSGAARLPDRGACSFFYPQTVRRAQLRGKQRCAASLEMLTGPWIILQYDGNSERKAGLVVFYRPPGETVDEFLYLLDYMRQHGLFDLERQIFIRSIDKAGTSLQNFQKARLHYIEAMGATDEGKNSLLDVLNNIRFELINNVISTFSEIQIGMSYDG